MAKKSFYWILKIIREPSIFSKILDFEKNFVFFYWRIWSLLRNNFFIFFSIVFFGRHQQRPCERQKFLPTDSNKCCLLQKCFFAKSLAKRDVFPLLNRTFCTKNKRAMGIQKIKKMFIFQSYLVDNASFVVKWKPFSRTPLSWKNISDVLRWNNFWNVEIYLRK